MTVAIVPLVETLVRPLVDHPEAVTVTQHETAEYQVFDLSVDPDDIGIVIGHQGRVAQALRAVVYGVKSPYTKRVRLNIVKN